MSTGQEQSWITRSVVEARSAPLWPWQARIIRSAGSSSASWSSTIPTGPRLTIASAPMPLGRRAIIVFSRRSASAAEISLPWWVFSHSHARDTPGVPGVRL